MSQLYRRVPGDVTPFEPSKQAVRAVREQLQIWGLKLSNEAVRRLLQTALAIEGPRIREEAARVSNGAVEALQQAYEDATQQLVRARRELAQLKGEAPPLTSEPEAEPASAEALVREKLGEDAPASPEQQDHPAHAGEGHFGLFGLRRNRGWLKKTKPAEGELFLFSQAGAKVIPSIDETDEPDPGRPVLRRPTRE
ncbi:MAG: hypothetical protein L0191_15840 [Acidobacteria bacterium]|nr:hypothetical protein [Acidobacteriota bacterium]